MNQTTDLTIPVVAAIRNVAPGTHNVSIRCAVPNLGTGDTATFDEGFLNVVAVP